MTVDNIKEYIDEHIDDDEEVHTMQELRTLYGSTLDEIRSMLDELDDRLKTKWIIDEYGDYHCEKCNAIIEKDEWGRHNYNYCYHCGARMEVDNEI